MEQADVGWYPPPSGRAGRSVDVGTALDAVADGSTVFVSGGAAVPLTVDLAMAETADRWRELTLVCDRLIEPLAAFGRAGEPFRPVTLFGVAQLDERSADGPATSPAANDRRASALRAVAAPAFRAELG